MSFFALSAPKGVYRLFLLAAATICLLHVQVELSIRGDLPADSDSMAYQYLALVDVYNVLDNTYSLNGLLYGPRRHSGEMAIQHPPVLRWSLLLGYLIFGLNKHAPYIVSGVWMMSAALAGHALSRALGGTPVLAAGCGLAMLGMPGALQFGFSQTMNVWPLTALMMLWASAFLRSDRLRITRWAAASVCWLVLALLTKAAAPGYLAAPLLVVASSIGHRWGSCDQCTKRNALLMGIVTALATGWFYLPNLGPVFRYYSYWSSTNLPTVLGQYGLHSELDRVLFYPKLIMKHMGTVFTGITVVSAGAIVRGATARRGRLRPATAGWLMLSLSAVPLVVYYSRNSFAEGVDISQIPFILVPCVTVAVLSIYPEPARRVVSWSLLVLTVTCNVALLGAHMGSQRYHGSNPRSAALELFNMLNRVGWKDVRITSLAEDIYFTVDALTQFSLVEEDWRHRIRVNKIRTTDIEDVISPTIAPLERYHRLAGGSDVLLVTSRPKGPEWIPLNWAHEVYLDAVSRDGRFFELGRLDAYDDGTRILVFSRKKVNPDLSEDGWLLNNARVRLAAPAGAVRILLTGQGNAHRPADLSLVAADGRSWAFDARGAVWSCELYHDGPGRDYMAVSRTPMVPSEVSASQDTRELLVLWPRFEVD